MTEVEAMPDWKITLLKQEVVARARFIASLDQSKRDQLTLAQAYISSLFGGVHGPGFARRLAWEIADESDTQQLRAAAKAKGMGGVVREIISQTQPFPQLLVPGDHIDRAVWILPAGGEVEEPLVIVQRRTNTVHLKDGAHIRRRAAGDPDVWFMTS